MRDKISTVKNPLTVIAIFAGTAEISGTAILPLLETQSQQTYIWFLMLFPIVLIVCFFLTLNLNYKVLYAPSDFSDEDNFVSILKKPTIKETILSIENDLQAVVADEEKREDTEVPGVVIDKAKENNSEQKLKTEIVKDITAQRIQEGRLAELLVLNKLEYELETPVQREMMIKVDDSKFIFDGVVQNKSRLTGIIVKFLRKTNTYNIRTWDKITDPCEKLYQSLSKSEKNSFSIILAVVTEEYALEIKQSIESKLNKMSFPIKIKVYDLDNLKNESTYELANQLRY